MKKNEYQCEKCNGIFEKGWSDLEADIESVELFGPMPKEDLAVICDDCFNELSYKWRIK